MAALQSDEIVITGCNNSSETTYVMEERIVQREGTCWGYNNVKEFQLVPQQTQITVHYTNKVFSFKKVRI